MGNIQTYVFLFRSAKKNFYDIKFISMPKHSIFSQNIEILKKKFCREIKSFSFTRGNYLGFGYIIYEIWLFGFISSFLGTSQNTIGRKKLKVKNEACCWKWVSVNWNLKEKKNRLICFYFYLCFKKMHP